MKTPNKTCPQTTIRYVTSRSPASDLKWSMKKHDIMVVYKAFKHDFIKIKTKFECTAYLSNVGNANTENRNVTL